jgi:hypothetical protein
VTSTYAGIAARSWTGSFGRAAFVTGERWRLTNHTDRPVDGDLLLVFDALPPGLRIANAEGVTARLQPRGLPYLRVRLAGGQIAPGDSVTVLLQLCGSRRTGARFHFRCLSGSGVP